MANLGFGVWFSKLKWVKESFELIYHANSIALQNENLRILFSLSMNKFPKDYTQH
jgi:hypothetical protein